jgi:hypothetical protein
MIMPIIEGKEGQSERRTALEDDEIARKRCEEELIQTFGRGRPEGTHPAAQAAVLNQTDSLADESAVIEERNECGTGETDKEGADEELVVIETDNPHPWENLWPNEIVFMASKD